MSNVVITMNVNVTTLFQLYQNGSTIPQINAQLGTIITHSVINGTLTHDPSYPNDSTKDTIEVTGGDTITWKVHPSVGGITDQNKCVFINIAPKANGSITVLSAAAQSADPSFSGQQQLNATALEVIGTNDYAITFTINNRQLTFDPKIKIKGHSSF